MSAGAMGVVFVAVLLCLILETWTVQNSSTTEPASENGSVYTICSQACVAREELRNATLDNIKQSILRKLGFTTPPKVPADKLSQLPPIEQLLAASGRLPHHTPAMQADQPEIDRNFGRGDPDEYGDEDYFAKTDQVISFASYNNKVPDFLKDLNLQLYQFTETALKNKVQRADLWVFIRGTQLPQNNLTDGSQIPLIDIKIFKVVAHSPYLIPLQQTTTIKVPEHPGLWITVDVTSLVSEWFARPQQNLGMDVMAIDADGVNLVAKELQARPFLDIYTIPGGKHRNRRSIGLDCDSTSEESRCCRYPLVVDFEEFGWDWVIAPKKYDAFYCAGECPFVFLQKYAHTHVISQVINKPANAGPCCAARKLSNISMLYFDSDMTIMLSTLPNMVVETCGCF